MSPDVLSCSALEETVEAIARVQLADGCIPWSVGGHADPWNHVEAAMALDAGGRHEPARAAYLWSLRNQRSDGAWAASYQEGVPDDATLDANFTAYFAAGVAHHFTTTADLDFLVEAWPCLERAVDFVLDLQLPGGEVAWARDARGAIWREALLTSSSCIYLSLRQALALARQLGCDRPDWELSLVSLEEAIGGRGCFVPKQRFSMDWYYPVLAGAVAGERARARLTDGWSRFVVPGLGVRCVSDRPWVTTGETCELILALVVAGFEEQARDLFGWVQHLRAPDGSYFTGATFPDGTLWPRETPTWCSAAAVLAAAALDRSSATARWLRLYVDDRDSLDPLADAL